MKKRYWLITFFILTLVFGIFNSCQKDEKKVINVYVEPEIKNYAIRLMKRYVKINDEIDIKINEVENLKSYDIILTNDNQKIKNIKRSYKELPFVEDKIVIVGRRKINNLDELLNSTIAIPNYGNVVGKLAVDILSESPSFNDINKKIEYKDEVMSCIEAVDLYEVDYSIITKLSLPYLKNCEICYRFPDEVEKNKISYKAYIKNKKDKDLRKIYDIIEDEILKNK